MNRRKLVLKNSIVVILFTVVNFFLGMWEVKLLISTYGPTVNGLMQTGRQVLSYLALIEAGIGAAFLYSMYKPIAGQDYCSLSSLYCGFRKSMNTVVIKMLIVAAVLAFLFPLFLSKEDLSYMFMVTILLLLSCKSIVPYFMIFVPKYMIIAMEQKYKVELISGLCGSITYALEILLMICTNLSLQVLLLVSIAVSCISGCVYQKVMKRIYGDELSEKAAPDLTPKGMSRDVLAHNISGLVFSSTDNIIISTMSSLNNVTIYSNYNNIITQVALVFKNVLDGAGSSMGIKVAKNDSNSYTVFREIFSGSLFLGGIIASVFVVMMNDFIKLWVGAEYCTSLLNTVIFGFIMYCTIMLPAIEVARNSKGLYKESKRFTIMQAAVNLGITLILTPIWGITGALIGTIAARICITIPMNYRLVYKKVFPKEKPKYTELIFAVFLVFADVLINILLLRAINIGSVCSSEIIAFIINSVIVTIVSSGIYLLVYVLSCSEFKLLIADVKRACKTEKGMNR